MSAKRLTVSEPPKQITGGQFEDLIVPRLLQMKHDREAAIDRPGVHATVISRNPDGTVIARLIASLPDFQGVYGHPQRETVFDLKVCSQASFNLASYRIEERKAKSRQLKFMLERSSFGSVCFFLMHWNERKLKTKTEPAVTYAFPVAPDHPFWVAFEVGTEKAIRKSHCEEYAIAVPWVTIGAERTARPHLLFALHGCAAEFGSEQTASTQPRSIRHKQNSRNA